MANTFDQDAFLNQDVVGANDTQGIPIPEGEYRAILDKFGIQQFTKSDSGEEVTTTILNVTWLLDDQDGRIEAVTGRNKNNGRQSVFLDMTPEGGLDMGKGMNSGLGRLREAIGQNDPTKRWAFSMMKGQVAKVTVKHKKLDDGAIVANVTKVSAL